ncbi:cell cycle histidine kinase CckA [Pelagibacterium lentulum]|uniref:histidine kinase n=1 Tax=Pelagibacterium lentulum TaxID=2029865 RepID=A0A916VX97_9HYPH|nr:PAS domain S-box protein [Pelagibacterium lentulum]GGA47844.1 signal transduction histidine kinase [Pelagibacterium lentulum]
MAVAPVHEDSYPEPVVARPSSGTAVWRVLLLALVFIGVAVGFSLMGDAVPSDMILLFLGILAVFGVFSLFALAAGLFRFVGGEDKRTVSRAIVDSLPYGAVVTDRDGKIVYANAAYADLSRDIAKGMPVGVPRLFASQPEASEAVYRLSRAARDGRTVVEDIRIGQPNGGTKWQRVSVRPLPAFEGDNGRSVIWSVEDISRDKESQENFYAELQKAIDYLDHAPAGFFSANSRGRIQYLNSTLADWLGYDLAAFEPGDLDLNEIVQGDGAGLLLGGGQDGTVRTEIVDLDLVRQDGTSFPVRLLHRAARLAEGELGETRTLVLDRSRAGDGNEALRAAEVRFSRFFNNTPVAIAALDREGKVVRTNAPFTRIFGLSTGERGIEGLDIASLIGEDSRAKLAKAFEEANAHRSEIAPVDANVRGEQQRNVRMYISGVERSEDSNEAMVLYALDTTEQRLLEEQFAQGQKMQAVGQLAGGVAHDFNNVLTAIIGFSDLLLIKHKPSDPSFGDIMSIKQSANRAAGLVRQLLAFSRRQTLRPQVLDIPQHIDDLTVLLKRLIGEHVSLDVEHAREVWPVRADLVQLEQVIINLVVNARDAMPEGGQIILRTRNVDVGEAETYTYRGMPPADYVLIEVADTGTGMSAEIMEKIFEPFFSTKELGKGTGLGLSMVYGIIKQTGGFIYPESEVGVGTTFRLFLPRHIPIEVEAPQKAVAAPIKDLTGHERILIVEDEESVRAFSARALSATGYEVLEAGSGEEALEVLDEIDGELDLLISDVVMPEMDGPALLKHVRQRYPDLKVIFVSGYAEESVRRDLEDDRSVEFLPKPYSLDQINTKVKDVLSGKQAEED